MADKEHSYDCIVIGSGHAGSCAALSAVEAGCRVLIVEKAPQEWSGGNGFFTAGAFRTVHEGLADLSSIVQNLLPEQAANVDMEPYTAEEFTNDIMRLSEGRSDPAIVAAVVEGSRDAVEWLARAVGVPFIFSFNRQAYVVNGRQKFWGGMVLGVENGGKGLMAAHQRALTDKGVETWYNTPAVRLLQSSNSSDGGAISGVMVKRDGQEIRLRSSAVILAAGGFESSAELRAKFLGKDWANARVRGTPFNTGDGLDMALAVGAARAGDWSYNGCHSTCWDADADANAGSRTLSNQYTKSGYPLGIMLNTRGLRFVDEGADFRNYTYAKYGRATLAQPGGVAFQVFDQRVIGWLRKEEYSDDVVKKVYANSISELAQKLFAEGLQDCAKFIETIRTYNDNVYAHRAAHPSLRWDPSVKDGLSTHAPSASELESIHEASPPLDQSPFILSNSADFSGKSKVGDARAQVFTPSKSNWALPLDKPPFLAVKVACGITFTFGGVAIDPRTASVLREPDGPPSEMHDLHTQHQASASGMDASFFPEALPQVPAIVKLVTPRTLHSKSVSPEAPVANHKDKSKTPPAPNHRREVDTSLPTASQHPLQTPRSIPGLFCSGEMVGGIFFGNYPGGSGLTSGAVFGRRAGRAAAEFIRNVTSNEITRSLPHLC